jgi:hypothetical protein
MKPYAVSACLLLAACGGGEGNVSGDAGVDATPDAGPPPVCVAALDDLTPNDSQCPNPEPATPDRLDEALSSAGLDRCSAVFTTSEWNYWGGTLDDVFRLPHFNTVHDAPFRAPGWAHETATALDAVDHPVANAIHLASHRLGRGGDEVCLPAAPAPSLAEALASLDTSFGTPTSASDIEGALAGVPADLQAALAPIVKSMEAAAKARDDAIASYAGDPLQLYDTIYTLILPHPMGIAFPLDGAAWEFLSGGFDAAALYRAATVLALTIENADLARFAGTTGFDVDLTTPLGRVLIRDAADDTYEPATLDESYALIVDTGGNDVYRVSAGATTTLDSRVAVAIDLGGNDEYAYVENPDPLDGTRLPSDGWGRLLCHPCVPTAACSVSATERQGAARMGIGLLFDLGGGDDQYRSLRLSQGFGALGVGVLFDDGGDDTYAIEAGGQGSALFGIGLLLDQGGADRYQAYEFSQGFGYSFGFGALRDGGAQNDVYFCDSGVPALGGDTLYLSAQLDCGYASGTCHYPDGCGNNSFCQGAGFGRRDDPACATCMSGGIGLLRDNGGDDVYTSGVFAQAAGYWFGTGVLDDEAGNDTYDGLWYVQGATAHFALSVFREGAGNDVYDKDFPIVATSIGVGHDYSVSLHLDLGGSDFYHAPGLSLGSGNVNGHGYLFNIGGNDTYLTNEGATLGGAGVDPARPAWIKTVGAFVDVGGTDTYTVAGGTLTRGDDSTWCADGDDGDAIHACGLDQSTGEVVLP